MFIVERSIIMNETYDPIDSFVKDVMGNIRFLDNLLSKTKVLYGIVGLVGTVGLLVAIALFLK
jgi:hypothetical protein